MHFFTSITLNYLPKARVLAKTVKKYNSGAKFYLMLADETPFNLSSDEPFDYVLKIKDVIKTNNIAAWIFKHSVVELCTAVKAAAALKILNDYSADKVVYLDPDIAVFDNLDNLSQLLDQNSLIITPHLTSPEVSLEGVLDNEICALKHGIYNLGFFAVKNCIEGKAFLNWWNERLMEFCYDDIPNGLFTDQRWIDLAPALFEKVVILRDPGHNVATWNLSARIVTKENEKYKVNGLPLRFFHFSGFDSKAHHAMLGKYAKGNEVLFQLSNWYWEEIVQAGQDELGSAKCSYSIYQNSTSIDNMHRSVYRNHAWLQTKYPDPYSCTDDCYYNWIQDNAENFINEKTINHSEYVKLQKILNITKKLFPLNSLRRRVLKNVYKFLSH